MGNKWVPHSFLWRPYASFWTAQSVGPAVKRQREMSVRITSSLNTEYYEAIIAAQYNANTIASENIVIG